MDKERFLSSGLLEQYALGLTTPEETQEVERYLQAYPELRSEVNGMRKAIEQYARHQSIPPPPHLKSKIISRIEGIEEASVPSPKASSSLRSLSRAQALTLAAAVLFGVLAFVFHRQYRSTNYDHQRLSAEFAAFQEECQEQQQRAMEKEAIIAFFRHPHTHAVALSGTALAPEAQVVVYWNIDERKAVFNNLTLPPPPPGKQYQIWADVAGKMIDIGLLDPDMNRLQSVRYIDQAESLNITLEPLGGSSEPTVSNLYANGKV